MCLPRRVIMLTLTLIHTRMGIRMGIRIRIRNHRLLRLPHIWLSLPHITHTLRRRRRRRRRHHLHTLAVSFLLPMAILIHTTPLLLLLMAHLLTVLLDMEGHRQGHCHLSTRLLGAIFRLTE